MIITQPASQTLPTSLSLVRNFIFYHFIYVQYSRSSMTCIWHHRAQRIRVIKFKPCYPDSPEAQRLPQACPVRLCNRWRWTRYVSSSRAFRNTMRDICYNSKGIRSAHRYRMLPRYARKDLIAPSESNLGISAKAVQTLPITFYRYENQRTNNWTTKVTNRKLRLKCRGTI